MRQMIASLRSFWSGGRRVERAAYMIGALLLASGMLHAAILVINESSWEGPLSLRKAATFGLSFGLTLITITWVATFVRLGDRLRALLLGTFTTASAVETALVSLQAWRGVPSHFNIETAIDGIVARTLAAGGIALISVIVVLTIAACRSNPTTPISMLIAIRIGFVTLCGAMASGGVMIANGMQMVFAGNAQTAYATAGALKPTHGVFMHGILLLPVLAWLLSFTFWSERFRLALVLAAGAGYALCTGVIATANLRGVPLREVSLPAFSAAAIGALAFVSTCGLTLVGLSRHVSAGGSLQSR